MSILMSKINAECGNLLNSLDTLDLIISSQHNINHNNDELDLINQIEHSINIMLQVIEESDDQK